MDLEDLQCPANETVFGIAENVVCGTDNNTYPSVCSLLQRTSGVRVAHAGACDIPECRSGPVSLAHEIPQHSIRRGFSKKKKTPTFGELVSLIVLKFRYDLVLILGRD